ncbi:hypothetical protein C8R44DRAFT_822467 [Mycena epipterygia]|nr:hypothetical protein C8R44DRAFT_822467 [Mycena epipterygia]
MPEFTDASDPWSPTSDETNPPDVIIRSSDMVDFHAHKAILSFGSVVFKDMFSFPEPAGEEANLRRDGKAVVPLPESSKAIEKLLTLCYPRFTSSYLFRDLDGVDAAYASAGKYQIPGGQELLERLLWDRTFLEKDPHRVFAIACHRGLEEIAKAAAMETLKLPHHVPNLSVPEFKFMSAYQLWQLQDFHTKCSQAIAHLIENLTRLANLEDDINDALEYPEFAAVWWDHRDHSAVCGPVEDDYIFPAKWFRDHMERVRLDSTRSPAASAAFETMSRVAGLTLEAITQCPKCARLAPYQLVGAASNLEYRADQNYAKILAQFSFVG